MICPDCHGRGHFYLTNVGDQIGMFPAMLPCESCGGTGFVSCCDGACGNNGDIGNDPEPGVPGQHDQA